MIIYLDLIFLLSDICLRKHLVVFTIYFFYKFVILPLSLNICKNIKFGKIKYKQNSNTQCAVEEFKDSSDTDGDQNTQWRIWD